MSHRNVIKNITIICVFSFIAHFTSHLCAQSDFGDLPSSYGVASHGQGSLTLFMGDTVDYETSLNITDENSLADDNNDIDDEDALLTASDVPTASILIDIAEDNVIFRLNIICTNNTGSAATLGAWIDLNSDGVFETGEYASATVADGSNKVGIELQWGDVNGATGLTSGDADIIALRLRLAPTLSSSDFAGSKPNGEVEDYWVPVSCACGKGVTNYWYFGKGRGLNFNVLTTSTETGYTLPTSIAGGQTYANEGTSSISNACGDRLVYSDGDEVWNANHEIIPGMEDLARYSGSSRSKYHPTQSGLLLKAPFRNDIFYLFSSPAAGNNGPLEYSVIDMTKERGLGGVAKGVINHSGNKISHPPSSGSADLLQIPFTFTDPTGSTSRETLNSDNVLELLTAIETPERDGYWVFCHGKSSGTSEEDQWDKSFFIGKLTVDGIEWRSQYTYGASDTEFIFNGSFANSAISYMKFPPQGDKFVVSCSTNLYIYKFDRKTGVITDEQILLGGTTGTEGGVAVPLIAIPSKDLTGSNTDDVSDADRLPFVGVDWIASSTGDEFYSFSPTSGYKTDSYDSRLSTFTGDYNYLYGVEFSTSGNMLYVSSHGNGGTSGAVNENGIIYQIGNLNSTDYDTNNPRIESVFMVDNIKAGTDPAVSGAQNEFKYPVSGLQLGKDEKIYFTDGGSRYLGVIHRPEEPGTDCDIEPFAIDITNGPQTTNNNRAMLGFPNYSASNFYKPTITTELNFTSVGADLDLRVHSRDTYTSVRVDFGDGSNLVDIDTEETTDLANFPLGYKIIVNYNGVPYKTGTDLVFSEWPIELNHKYTSAGDYTVSLYYKEGKCDYKFNDITIHVESDITIDTEHVDQITRSSATIHGKITDNDGFNEEISEIGFIYSYVATTDATLKYPLTPNDCVCEIVSSHSPTLDVSDELLFSQSITGLEHRQYVYYRAYLKTDPASGDPDEYVYGEVKRFITEERDFSLKVDGGSVVVDQANTKSSISDWNGGLSFSFDLWVKRTRNGTEEAILKNEFAGYKILFDSDDKLVFDYTTTTVSGAFVTDMAVSDSEWHHIAIACDNSSTLIYVDGSPVATTGFLPEYSFPDDLTSGYLFVGGGGVVETTPGSGDGAGEIESPFIGYIDALRFWGVKLTENQVKTLRYDNVIATDATNASSPLALAATPNVAIAGITTNDLKASFGFNVESVLTSPESLINFPFFYNTQAYRLDHDFFHEDSRLKREGSSLALFGYNAVSIGNVAPSVVIPRVNWCNDISPLGPDSESWFNPSNWSGFAYPSQGITTNEAGSENFNDIEEINGTTKVPSNVDNCRYTIINEVQTGNSKPIVGENEENGEYEMAKVHYLIDKDPALKSYEVDDNDSSKLIIHDGVQQEISPNRVMIENGTVVVEEGSVEVGD